jgi:hypothetical protein
VPGFPSPEAEAVSIAQAEPGELASGVAAWVAMVLADVKIKPHWIQCGIGVRVWELPIAEREPPGPPKYEACSARSGIRCSRPPSLCY